jgi:hypothetical protein
MFGFFVFLVKKKKTPPLFIFFQRIMQAAVFGVQQQKRVAG